MLFGVVNDYYLRQILRGRGTWMKEVSERLGAAGSDRWHRSEERESWDQFFDQNPSIDRPEDFAPFRPLEHDGGPIPPDRYNLKR